MKFIKERLDVKYIQRRIREEDAKSDRKVTEVLLTPQEWYDFISTTDAWRGLDYIRMAVTEPLTFSLPCEATTICDGPRVVTIRRG
jgi:hypothetical protein